MPPGDSTNDLNASLRENPSDVVPGRPGDQNTFAPGERIDVRSIGDEAAGIRVNGETVREPGDALAFDEDKNTVTLPERFTSGPGDLTIEVFTEDGQTQTLETEVVDESELSERERELNRGGQQNITASGQAAAATDEDVFAATTEELRASRGISAEALTRGEEPSTLVGPDALGNPTSDAAFIEERERLSQPSEATARARQQPFDEDPSEPGIQVGGVDGRKARIEGAQAGVNPSDETRAVVLDRGGDEGRRAFPLLDDPVAPDTPEAAREIGEPGTSDVAINRRGNAQRVGALPTVFAEGEEPPSQGVNPRGDGPQTPLGGRRSNVPLRISPRLPDDDTDSGVGGASLAALGARTRAQLGQAVGSQRGGGVGVSPLAVPLGAARAIENAFGPDRAPEPENPDPIAERGRDITGLPTQRELTADLQAMTGLPNKREFNEGLRESVDSPSESEVVDSINEELAIGGETPTERFDQARGEAREETLDTVGDALEAGQENPRAALAAGAPVALAEPTPVGEAALLGGAAAGVIGVDVASRVDSDEQSEPGSVFGGPEIETPERAEREPEIETPDEPEATQAELGAPDSAPGSDAEVPTPESAPGPTPELGVPSGDATDPFVFETRRLRGGRSRPDERERGERGRPTGRREEQGGPEGDPADDTLVERVERDVFGDGTEQPQQVEPEEQDADPLLNDRDATEPEFEDQDADRVLDEREITEPELQDQDADPFLDDGAAFDPAVGVNQGRAPVIAPDPVAERDDRQRQPPSEIQEPDDAFDSPVQEIPPVDFRSDGAVDQAATGDSRPPEFGSPTPADGLGTPTTPATGTPTTPSFETPTTPGLGDPQPPRVGFPTVSPTPSGDKPPRFDLDSDEDDELFGFEPAQRDPFENPVQSPGDFLGGDS